MRKRMQVVEPELHKKIRHALRLASANESHIGSLLETFRSLDVNPFRLGIFYKEIRGKVGTIKAITDYILGRVNEKRDVSRKMKKAAGRFPGVLSAIRIARYVHGIKLSRVLEAVKENHTSVNAIQRYSAKRMHQTREEREKPYEQRLVEAGIQSRHLEWVKRAIEGLEPPPNPESIVGHYREHPTSKSPFRESVLRGTLGESTELQQQIEFASCGERHLKFHIRTAIHHLGIPASRVLFTVQHGPKTPVSIELFHKGVNTHLSGARVPPNLANRVAQYVQAHPKDDHPIETKQTPTTRTLSE